MDEYIAVFTANASGALKLVGEVYPFTPASRCILTFDNHNSVNGIREFAKVKGAQVTYVPLTRPDLRIDGAKLSAIRSTKAIIFGSAYGFMLAICQSSPHFISSSPTMA